MPHTNQVRGAYCKLRSEYFPHRFMAQVRRARVINRRLKMRYVTYSTDREDEVSKILYLYL